MVTTGDPRFGRDDVRVSQWDILTSCFSIFWEYVWGSLSKSTDIIGFFLSGCKGINICDAVIY